MIDKKEVLVGQLNLFREPLKIHNQVRLIELFAGIGSQAKALKRLGVDFVPWVVCEFDKYAIKSYNAVHGTDFKVSDITELHGDNLRIKETDKYTYIMTYSFPCQDLSNAGKQKGMSKGSGTRSGLLWEVERLLNECTELPQILLCENVPQVISKKNIGDFKQWLLFLELKGYYNDYKLLNAKDYGIPQNRNRFFMLSHLEDSDYIFPEPIPLDLRIRDFLEKNASEKFYMTEEKTKSILRAMENPTTLA